MPLKRSPRRKRNDAAYNESLSSGDTPDRPSRRSTRLAQKRSEAIDEPCMVKSEDTNPKEEEESSDEQLVDVLDALLELRKVDDEQSYARDQLTIEESIRLNECLQLEALAQLDLIDKHLHENEKLADEVRKMSLRETALDRRRLELHRKYPTKYDFFVDADGQKPSLGSSDNIPREDEDNEGERSRSWHTTEREKLSNGIHTEARRMLAYEHLSRKEPWKVWEVDRLSNEVLESHPVNCLDWDRISKLYVKTRTPLECMIQWTTQDHPKINKKPWSKDESRRLAELVKEYGFEGQWEKIAVNLNTNRTASQCFSHYQAESNLSTAKRKWTPEDDDALREAVELFGDCNWQQVASMVNGRTGQQCLQRWMKCINPAIRRSRWTQEEDTALRAAVGVYGVGNWTKVQRYIPGRTDMQCRERWMNVLDPRINHSSFSKEEKKLLKSLVEQHGRKWSLIARFMPGRTDNHLLREWRVATRRRKKENTDDDIGESD